MKETKPRELSSGEWLRVAVRGADSDGNNPEHWLGGGGEMGKAVLAKDWSETPLGPIDSWPQSLRTTVSLCLASNFPISIAWGPEHTQLYNDGYWPICGAKHPTSMGQNFAECWASAWPAIGKSFERALRGETSFLEDQRMFLDRNGYLEETFFTFSFSPIRDESGGVGGLFHPVTETTAKLLNQRRIRALRDLASRTNKAPNVIEALQHAVDALAGDDLDLPFVLVYETLFGRSDARLIAACGLATEATASPMAFELDAADAPWPIAEVLATNLTRRVTDLGRLFAGTPCGPYPEVPRGAMLLPITPPGSSRPTAVMIAGISSRLPLNESYRGFYDLLAAATTAAVATAQGYEDAQARAEALAQIDRAKTAFFSNVSHEFRTPLTLMLGPTEEALASSERALTGENLDAVYRNQLRLLKLVNMLLDFSRIEAGRARAAYVPSDLATLTVDLAGAFRSATERAGIRLEVDCPPLSEPVYVDHDMWEKIVLNLLSNALKFTFDGWIAVSLRREADTAVLRVADSGVGIPRSELPRLFERFHRVEGARSRTHEGSGIGLALVNELVHLHGGSLRVTSEVGVGTTFTITIAFGTAHLPAEQLSDARSEFSTATGAAPYVQEALRWLVPTKAPQPAADGEEGADRARILVADDNADMRDYICRLIGDRWKVETVASGDAALASIRGAPPDLLVTDIMMPGLDGFALLREVRRDAATRKLPVIFVSARAGEGAKVEGLEAGADDYLVKPFSGKELIARVQTHLTLARLRSDFETASDAVRMRDEFLSIAGHELRTPLAALQLQMEGLLKIFVRDQHGSRLQGRLERATSNVHRLASLVSELLDVTRITSSGLVLHRERIDLVVISKNVIGHFRDELEESGCEVVFHPDGRPQDACIGDWDRPRVEQIVTNLIGNAIKYGRGRPIEVDVLGGDGMATIHVTDHGIGISPDAKKRIFERFERAVSPNHFGGFGLGLWISRKIAEAHGGSIAVDSVPDEHTTFVVQLPCSAAAS